MIRWILLLFSLASLGLMFFGPSPGWVLFGVAGFLLGSIATTLSFAQSRIASSARQADLQIHQQAPRPRSEEKPAPPSEPR